MLAVGLELHDPPQLRQAGEVLISVTLSTYAHLFDDFDGGKGRSAEERIRAARR